MAREPDVLFCFFKIVNNNKLVVGKVCVNLYNVVNDFNC